MPGVDFAFTDAPVPRGTGSTGRVSATTGNIIANAALRYGQNPEDLKAIAWLESRGNTRAKNPKSSAGGLFQFVDGTAADYGLANRFDAVEASDAAARLMRDNRAVLKKALGREPTRGELYLAHQQGAGGASKLLSNPNVPAASLVGAEAVALNGGRPGMTAGQFAGLWLAKAGGAPGAALDNSLPGGTSGAVTVKLTGAFGGVPQMPGVSVAADAYNQAAADITLNRLETAMRGKMDALAIRHSGDPAGLEEALDASWSGIESELPPLAKARVRAAFERNKIGIMIGAASDYRDRFEEEVKASFETQIESRRTSILRNALKAGSDETADAAIAAELAAINADIDAAPMTPLARERLKRETAQEVISARLLGGFEQQQDAAGRAAFLQRFQEEWKAGEGLSEALSPESYDKLTGEMTRRLQADEVAARKRDTALQKDIDGQIKILKKGLPIPAERRDALARAVAETGDPDLSATMQFLDGLADWQKAHIAARPEVVRAQIAALEDRIARDGATDTALTTLDVMEGLAGEMEAGLDEDPLTFASRAGVAAVEPIDFSSADTLTASLAERVNDAEAIAGHYGRAPRYFTPAEAEALKQAVQDDPMQLPGLVAGLTAGLGDAAPAALAEVSKEAPVLAHLGGLYHATGNGRLAAEIAEGLHLRAMDGYSSPLPSNAKLDAALAETAGAAFYAVPQLRDPVRRTANILFERRIAALGIDATDFDMAGNAAREAYGQAVEEVLGATWRDGVKHGGIATVNGVETIAPPGMRADALEDLVGSISEDDLAAQMPIGTANGVPITAAQIRGGVLVNTGPGRYRVALGDPYSGDPRFVPAAAGGYFELDVSLIAPRQPSRPFGRRLDLLQEGVP
ncbi:hypothetical protein E0D97_06235 [Oricola cellulosilytica]|uniref:Transglycosylase SLT domain-containing protein n=2 Tax=Oricola cellulosilytica TaxID=1429082 RepID=A0A4R0PDC7_9HYPH|nr:hypothetical protein E0D97_06235 [Oricola cellulosilytica]